MNEDALILVVRIVAILLFVLIVILVTFNLWRSRQRNMRKNGYSRRKSVVGYQSSDGKEDSLADQQTAQLNPSFFGTHDERGHDSRHHGAKTMGGHAPSATLPYTIMARFGRTLTGSDVANLVRTFGLQRAPSGAYELIGEDGEEIVFTMLNVRKPGVFPEDLNTLEKLEGLMLIMQLPVGDDAVKSWETFTAVAHEMTETIDARLCDFERRPIGDADLLKYRQAAEQFEHEYRTWQQHQ